MKKLWFHIKKCQATFAEYLKNKWGNINPGNMEDDVKKLRKGLTDLRGIDKRSNAFMGI